jgi:hypothetical protein
MSALRHFMLVDRSHAHQHFIRYSAVRLDMHHFADWRRSDLSSLFQTNQNGTVSDAKKAFAAMPFFERFELRLQHAFSVRN